MIQRLLAVLLSTDSKQRVRVIRSLMAANVYVLCIGIMGFASQQGLMRGDEAALLSGLIMLNVVVWYGLLRSGFNRRFREPSLTLPQILSALTWIVAAYAITGVFHGATMMLLTLVLVFGIFNLNARDAKIAGGYAVVLTGIVMGYKTMTDPAGYPVALESVHFALVVSSVPTISMLTAQLSNLRARLRAKQEELTQALDRIQVLATHDELTGLYNRRHMMSVLDEHQRRLSRSSGHDFCLAILDIDFFKHINDTHGHSVGDEVLRNFATHAATMTRETDVLARWGGEEFMLVLVGTTAEDAEHGIQRLRDSLKNVTMAQDHLALRPSFSAGLSAYQTGENLAACIERADKALYSAKQSGRNRTVIWSDVVLARSATMEG
ncbi:GGDEF domain-containing protein [Aquabacterium sp.]|uniref:GGDEF domain-containing protein n=1 Tax=Aquabacterium sp. TaxID=1872578 RepID=UPI002488F26A|nr:GGDEF domain-containing protein [Aquabacterium sp.]MDI1258211.1 GGDEF domain-containing protein [Aquabacterium sp.]